MKHNARAVKQYEEGFAGRKFELLTPLRLKLKIEGVTISVTPDLHVREGGKIKVVKLEFSNEELSEQAIKVLTQCLCEAAWSELPDLTGASAVPFDVPRGRECRGARAGSRMWREVEAACKTIAQV